MSYLLINCDVTILYDPTSTGLNLYCYTARPDSVFIDRISKLLLQNGREMSLFRKYNDWSQLQSMTDLVKYMDQNPENFGVTLESFLVAVYFHLLFHLFNVIVFLCEILHFKFGAKMRRFIRNHRRK